MIASKVYEDPNTTEDMVELVQFLSKVITTHRTHSLLTTTDILLILVTRGDSVCYVS